MQKFGVKLSAEQAQALETIGAWLRHTTNKSNTDRKQYLTLGGYAGTGKTTLLGALRYILKQNNPDIHVAFAAYTGKAAVVLKNTLKSQKTLYTGDNVSTLHSLMYYSDAKVGDTPHWRKREHLKYQLIVIDEASMVGEDIWQDLLSFGLPVLAVGDHGQLPPIGTSFNLMQDPEIRLETIWRQEQDSPIIELATTARHTGNIAVGKYGAGVEKLDKTNSESGERIEELLTQTQTHQTMVLCGYNHTRQKLNKHMRTIREFETADPVRGDTIVCLRNNRETGLHNGMLGTISAVGEADHDPDNVWWYMQANFDDILFEGYCPRAQFGASTTLRDVPRRKKADITGLFDFGYALTVHKAQGSQAQRVIVFEERFSQMSDEDWRRWLYTAVTRAEQELYIIGN